MEELIKLLDWIEVHPIASVPFNIACDIAVNLLIYVILNKVLKRIFNPNRDRYNEDDQKRVSTLQKVSILTLKTVMIVLTMVEVLSKFIDIQAILTVAGVGTIAIGIGAQAIVSDILNGFSMLAENQFYVGDYIEIDDNHYGRVEHIGLRTTRIRQLDDSLHIVRNGEIMRLTNYSKGTVKAIAMVSIAYEENIQGARTVINALLENLPKEEPEIFIDPPVIVGVEDLDDSSVVLRVEANVKADHKKQAERLLRQHLKEALQENGIEIPYPKQILYPMIPENEKENPGNNLSVHS